MSASKIIFCISCRSKFDAYAFGTAFPACCPSCGEAGSEPLSVEGRSGSWWQDRLTRTVKEILRGLTPKQMAEEIVRLDAVIDGRQPNITIGRLPPGVKTVDGGQK